MRKSHKDLKLPLTPIRKSSPQFLFSARTPSGFLNARVSSFSPTSRCLTSQSRPRSSLSPSVPSKIAGLPHSKLLSIYSSKCTDLSIPENAVQSTRFCTSCEKSIRNRFFTIREQELGPVCAKTIGKILRNSSYFCGVVLSLNHLQDSGVIKLSESLVKNGNIIHFDVSSNGLSAEGIKAIVEIWMKSESLISLDVSSYNGLSRNRLNSAASETLGKFISSSRILCYLELNDSNLNDTGFEFIATAILDNSCLLRLGLSDNYITSKHLDRFCKNLITTNIQELSLAGNRISDEGCRSLADLIVDNDFDCKLAKLDLSKNEITFKGSNSIFLGVRYNPTMTHLNMESNPLGSASGQSLHFLLLNNCALVWLNLNSCALKNGGISHLSLGLEKNKALRTLLLSNNHIKDIGLSSITQALIPNSTLLNLDLSKNEIQDGTTLAGGLKINKGLRTINCKENKIKEHAGPLLLEAIQTNSRILKLNLEDNHITLKNLNEIQKTLKRNEEIFFKKKAPSIKKKIERIQVNFKDLQSIHDEISKKQHEKVKIVNKISRLKDTVNDLRIAVDPRLAELQAEYKECRDKSFLLSNELENLNKEIIQTRVKEETNIREFQDKLGFVVYDTKCLEKKKLSRREELANKRSTMNLIIEKCKESLKTEGIINHFAVSKLSTLNAKILLLKAELDKMKYSDSYFEERKALSPSPILRITRRSELQILRKDRSKTITNRKVFELSPAR